MQLDAAPARAAPRIIRLFLLIEVVAFFAAALVHFGILASGYEHTKAAVAESVIGAVLFLGLLLTWITGARTRTIGLAAQGFGLLGTLVGAFTIIIGVGPRTAPDIAYHVAIVGVLIAGLVVSRRAPAAV